jgi:hypothetical protein
MDGMEDHEKAHQMGATLGPLPRRLREPKLLGAC